MLLSQLVEVPERLESALLLLAPRYDTPDMIIKVINARITLAIQTGTESNTQRKDFFEGFAQGGFTY